MNQALVNFTVAVGALAVFGCATSKIASAAGSSCQGVDQTLSVNRKQEYAALVAGAQKTKVSPSKITITRFMQSGPWSAVWAGQPDAENGVFFFG